MAAAPTKGQVLRLYRNYLHTAQSFASYNFRTYFLRRSRDLFRSTLLPASQAQHSSPFSRASGLTVAASPSTLSSPEPTILSDSGTSASGASDEERLRVFYETAKRDLEVLRRSALTNRMYEGEKLVVEKPRLILGGGGGGAEASTGGSGQPRSGGPGSGDGAPPSGVWADSQKK